MVDTYAARFCAFLRDCAGVRLSFSSLLPLLPDRCSCSLSKSNAIPLSTEPLGKIDSDCDGGDAEPVGIGVMPVVWPSGALKS